MPRILIAEDDDAVREFVARALALQGHEVTAVIDGGAALEALAAGPYDLLLTDIVMPGLDGIALALKVAKERPSMPVLLMTGYAAERHGTAVAGILVARADNGIGMVGIAPAARLLVLRGCRESASGATVCDTLALARALQPALDS